METETTVEEALRRIAERTEGSGIAWVVGGSAGLMLRGLPLAAPPRDLDLYADPEDAAKMHEALGGWAVDVPVRSRTERYDSILSHYRIGDIEVELVGGFVVADRGCRYEVKVRDVLLPEAERRSVSPDNAGVLLAPLAHELWFNWLRGRDDRIRLIAAAMSAEPERQLRSLRRLTASGRFTPEAVAAVEALIAARCRRPERTEVMP